MRSNRVGLALGLLLLTGCTTVGVHDRAALRRAALDASAVTVSLCAYLDDGITADEASGLVDEAWAEDAGRYGVLMRIVETRRWKRPAFTADGIMDALRREPVLPPCDRIMAFVGRHTGDVLWGLFLPQALGAVDAETRTRGFVVARVASLDQAIMTPAHVLNHELHHMLGCDHDATLATCYERIAALKEAQRRASSPPLVAQGASGADPAPEETAVVDGPAPSYP